MNEAKVPGNAWVTTFAGTAINACLGILYAWSVWKAALVAGTPGTPMTGLNEGWTFLTNAQVSTPFSLCVFMFMAMMIPGGKIQDKISPKFGATLGGLCLALGCIVAGLMKSYTGLVIGFGLMGGMGMGIGYAAPTPAALKWFGPHKRGLIAALVVMGYGGAAIYISPLAKYLITNFGLTGSFVSLGIFFAVVVIVAGQLLRTPPEGYVPPAPAKAQTATQQAAFTKHDWEPSEIFKTWQYYCLVIMFIFATQAGLLIIGNAAGLLKKTAAAVPFLLANAWIIASYGGLVNAAGRVGTGMYSDAIGRGKAYAINNLAAAICMFSLPAIIASQNLFVLFIAVGVGYWQYGGLLSLFPSFAADYYGPKNLGVNYGLIFIGWGLGAFMPRLGGTIQDMTGSLNYAFYLSGLLLVISFILSIVIKRPKYA